MIKANYTWLGVTFFWFYSRYRLGRNFRNINLCGDFNDTGNPILVIGNHFSWWDGFIQIYLNESVLHRKFHVMMMEEELRRNMILNRTGAFSVKKSSRDIVESLRYCVELLKNPDNMVLIFPQGEIQTMHARNFAFERGVEYILRQLKTNNIDLIFNVNLTDYFSKSKPSLNIYYKNYALKSPANITQIEQDYNDYVRECIEKQTEQ